MQFFKEFRKLLNSYFPKLPEDNHRSFVGICWVSFFWSFSSLMVFSVLPAFLTDVIKISYKSVGLLEGVAISLSFLSKVGSGFGSDLYVNRRSFIIIGTLFTILTRPLFAFAWNPASIYWARFIDRFGKGIRSAPTDALIGDLSSGHCYGRAFGIRQSMYTLGAVFGAAASMLAMYLSNNNYRLVFQISTIPVFFALIILWWKVDYKNHPRRIIAEKKNHLTFQQKWLELIKECQILPFYFWLFCFAAFFLMMARFSEAFLTLRAKEVGLGISFLPIIIILMDIIHATVAVPFGALASKWSKKNVLLAGLFVFILTDGVMVLLPNLPGTFLAISLLGVHMGMTQGTLRGMVVWLTPDKLRGTAFSIFYLISGVGVFMGNFYAGRFASAHGLTACFIWGGICTLVSFFILMLLPSQDKISQRQKEKVLAGQAI